MIIVLCLQSSEMARLQLRCAHLEKEVKETAELRKRCSDLEESSEVTWLRQRCAQLEQGESEAAQACQRCAELEASTTALRYAPPTAQSLLSSSETANEEAACQPDDRCKHSTGQFAHLCCPVVVLLFCTASDSPLYTTRPAQSCFKQIEVSVGLMQV